MGNRRALITADIAHAGLQQRLGDRKDSFASKRRATAEPQRLDLLAERAFHPLFRGLPLQADIAAFGKAQQTRSTAGRAGAALLGVLRGSG
jgi:hypothetical protein